MLYSPGKTYNLFEILNKADSGDLDAMETAAVLLTAEYSEDDLDGEILARRKKYLEQLVDAGNRNAMVMLADLYQNKDGLEKDIVKAIRLYEKAADCGVAFANEVIGLIYYDGDGVPIDYEKAYEYFTKDDNNKSFCTLYALAEMYRNGLFVPKNEETAAEYYSKIATSTSQYVELDDYYWRACYRLAVAKHYGSGIERDLNGALTLMETAKKLFNKRGKNAVTPDISKEDFDREWILLNQDAGKY